MSNFSGKDLRNIKSNWYGLSVQYHNTVVPTAQTFGYHHGYPVLSWYHGGHVVAYGMLIVVGIWCINTTEMSSKYKQCEVTGSKRMSVLAVGLYDSTVSSAHVSTHL